MQPGAREGLALVTGLGRGEACRELTLPLQGGCLAAALQVPAGGWKGLHVTESQTVGAAGGEGGQKGRT